MERELDQINVIPLVDVMLVLLVIVLTTATFISTALALQMRQGGLSLETHFRIVDSLAILFFLLVTLLIFFSPVGRKAAKKA